jgi:eukaryotic-like serine/threonine-protein kinase
MTSSRRSEETIFAQALELSAAARAAYLESACAGDATLRDAVVRLLRAHEGDAKFMAEPAVVGATAALAAFHEDRASDEKRSEWIGRYKLLQKIGEGGCGTVYMAEQEEPVRRRVALKVIKLGMDTREVIARARGDRAV